MADSHCRLSLDFGRQSVEAEERLRLERSGRYLLPVLHDEKPGLLTSGTVGLGVNPEQFWLGFNFDAMDHLEAALKRFAERFALSHGRARQRPAALVCVLNQHHPVARIDDAGFGAEFQAARKAPIALKDACCNTGQ